jgi:RNA polymerase sigma factor (TIGR02999 family)
MSLAPSQPPGDPLASLLARFKAGEMTAGEAVVLALEDKLVEMARRTKRNQSPSVSLQTLDLVGEALLKLMRRPPELSDDSHFLGYLAHTMRSVLIDYHRHRKQRREAESEVMELRLRQCEKSMRSELPDGDELLERLRRVRPIGAEILFLSLYGGQPQHVIAETLGLSLRTVEREAREARMWLREEAGRD